MLVVEGERALSLLRRGLSSIPGVLMAVLFGSVARGDYRPDSDLDLLVVAEDSAVGEVKKAVRELSSSVYVETGVPISAIVVGESDFSSERWEFIRRAKREGFQLWRRS